MILKDSWFGDGPPDPGSSKNVSKKGKMLGLATGSWRPYVAFETVPLIKRTPVEDIHIRAIFRFIKVPVMMRVVHVCGPQH